MGANYNKYKDNDPQDTIFRIQEILNRAGLFTVMRWLDTKSEGAPSNRITLYPTQIGANGKGTDKLYTSASGYAELMERMQNNVLAGRAYNPRVVLHGDFRFFPDEKEVPIIELAKQDDAISNHFFSSLGCNSNLDKQLYLLKYASIYEKRNDGMITAVPFADVTDSKVVYLPISIITPTFSSNGMAAGNTIEEAIVQGMSEIYERHVNKMLLIGKAVPPEIPEEELRNYSIWDLKKELEGDGRYHISVRDCSLGKGYPVAASIITDRRNGTFGIKLGSHPSMAVAVERTLTEALQGRSAEEFASTNEYGSKEQAESYHNIPNVMKVNVGVYPATLLSGKPDWEYRPWTEWEGKNNKEFVAQMIRMAERDGWHLFIRDNSHMGFSAVQIVVPGYSELYEICGTFYRALNTGSKVFDAFEHFPDLTRAEEKSVLNMIRFKEKSCIENTSSAIIGRPVTDQRMIPVRIAAFIALKLGEYKSAEYYFTALTDHFTDEDDTELEYYKALKNWCKARVLGLNDDEAYELVSMLFTEEIVSRVRKEISDIDGILKRNFPTMKCYDCENCELNDIGCEGSVEEDIFIRIKDAMKNSKVSQEKLLERISSTKQL